MRVEHAALDWRTKGLWLPDDVVEDLSFIDRRASLFDGDFAWPVLVARASALTDNIRTMSEYCARHEVLLAPHGKTTMSPTLFAAQLAAGAWGITVATPNQLLAARSFGVSRVILANEVLDRRVVRWILREIEDDREFTCIWYIDSVEGLEVIESVLVALGRTPARPLTVVVELGYEGGRTGVRDAEAAADLARRAALVEGVEVVGIAGYEGGLTDLDHVRAYFSAVGALADRLRADRVIRRVPVVTVGGSVFFDLAVDELTPAEGAPERTVILRSGAYVSHDHGTYARRTPFRRLPEEGELRPALEVWAQVLSTPEVGFALLGVGKRDVPQDEGFPVVTAVRRDGEDLTEIETVEVYRLDDHHAYLRTPEPLTLAPGDLVRLGISHPCTAFDRWSVVPVLDDEHRVVDLLSTYF